MRFIGDNMDHFTDKRLRVSRILGLGLLTAIIVAGITVGCVITGFASDGTPEGMFSWYDECGYVCYQWADGSGDCYPCLTCEECDECEMPNPNSTPNPKSTPDPTSEPTREVCNRGLGNGSEDCDPGNSGGKPGAAGEDNE